MARHEGGEKTVTTRREAIFQYITDNGLASVSELSRMFDVTDMTIRRDLETLEKEKLVERTHGGAVPTNRGKFEPLFTQKSLLHRAQKDVIAARAGRMVEDYDTIFINSGSTTLRIFKQIQAHHVKIVTNNASFPLGDFSEDIEVIATGGIFRRESYTFIGDTAAHTVGNVYASKAFIGLDGFDLEHGMTTPVQSEAGINKLMIEHTRGSVVIVADSSKIGRVSNFFVAPAVAADILITDDGIDSKLVAEIEKSGIEVIVC